MPGPVALKCLGCGRKAGLDGGLCAKCQLMKPIKLPELHEAKGPNRQTGRVLRKHLRTLHAQVDQIYLMLHEPNPAKGRWKDGVEGGKWVGEYRPKKEFNPVLMDGSIRLTRAVAEAEDTMRKIDEAKKKALEATSPAEKTKACISYLCRPDVAKDDKLRAISAISESIGEPVLKAIRNQTREGKEADDEDEANGRGA